MAGSGLKGFWAFLKEGQSAQEWVAKAMLATFLLDWIVAFGPPQPSKTLVSFLTVVFELITAIIVYEYFQGKRVKTYRLLLGAGIVCLVLMVIGYVGVLLDRVLVLSPRFSAGSSALLRVVKGGQYEQFATQYREGYRKVNGRYPSDLEMLEEYLDTPDPGGDEGADTQQSAERLWTRASISRSTGLLLLLWVGMFSTLTYCVLIFLMRQRRAK